MLHEFMRIILSMFHIYKATHSSIISLNMNPFKYPYSEKEQQKLSVAKYWLLHLLLQFFYFMAVLYTIKNEGIIYICISTSVEVLICICVLWNVLHAQKNGLHKMQHVCPCMYTLVCKKVFYVTRKVHCTTWEILPSLLTGLYGWCRNHDNLMVSKMFSSIVMGHDPKKDKKKKLEESFWCV